MSRRGSLAPPLLILPPPPPALPPLYSPKSTPPLPSPSPPTPPCKIPKCRNCCERSRGGGRYVDPANHHFVSHHPTIQQSFRQSWRQFRGPGRPTRVYPNDGATDVNCASLSPDHDDATMTTPGNITSLNHLATSLTRIVNYRAGRDWIC